MNLTDKIKKTVTDIAQNDIRILSVILHGSIQKGNFRPDSDIDLGVISSKNLIYATEALFNGNLIFTRDESRSNY